MTLASNSLELGRLVVLKSGGSLYDEKFHSGVNIIRGENSSGKSTIADFIFFVLGGDLGQWTPEAASADSVHAEVIFNGIPYTISREVETSGRPAMHFYQGGFDEAMSRRADWRRYSATRSSNNESFSQVMFHLLGLPEQRTEAQQNITMHQILRLMYLDQMTPVDQIFRKEGFDTRDIRIAVSELLLGLDDLELHDIRLQIRDADRRYGQLIGELKSIFQILGKTADSDVTVTDFQKERVGLEQERAEISKHIEQLSKVRDDAARARAGKRMAEAAEDLRKTNVDRLDLQQRTQFVALDIEDSERFIKTLRERVTALDASKGMGQLLGSAAFAICPACFSRLDSAEIEGICPLCKAKLQNADKWGGHLKMREELTFQIRESTKLLQGRVEERRSLQERTRELDIKHKRLMETVSEFARRFDPVDAEIASLQRRQGYIEKSIEDLARKAELADIVKAKMEQRDLVRQQLEALRERLEGYEVARQKRRSNVQYGIVEQCVRALRRDLPMEEVFREAKLVQFDFGQNQLAVNGRTRFSASSATYLKNAFLFSVFELSLYDRAMRWPRFILMDNIEDKGMQPKRSANFQEYVVNRSSQAEVSHQIIMTTSMISPTLENSAMCIGPHYTERNKTLRFAYTSRS